MNPQTLEQNFTLLREKFLEWLSLPDDSLLRVTVAAVLANRLPSDPLWMFIEAPPSSSKTEMLRALSEVPRVHYISTFTEKTLLSGEITRSRKRGVEPSLLLRLPAGENILVCKDFGSFLSQRWETREEIFSQLREVYDGQINKVFGTGEEKEWKGKLGLIAGVTGAVDMQGHFRGILGERFIIFRPVLPARSEVVQRALGNRSAESEMRTQLRAACREFFEAYELRSSWLPSANPIPPEYEVRIGEVADFVSRARTAVPRDSYGAREILELPELEGPARLVKCLANLMQGLLMLGDSAEENFGLIRKIGFDCLPPLRRKLLELVSKTPGGSTSAYAEELDLPHSTTKMKLEDLAAIGILSRTKHGGSHGDDWQVKEEFREFLGVQPAITEVQEAEESLLVSSIDLPF